jgi:hypothetical protein
VKRYGKCGTKKGKEVKYRKKLGTDMENMEEIVK